MFAKGTNVVPVPSLRPVGVPGTHGLTRHVHHVFIKRPGLAQGDAVGSPVPASATSPAQEALREGQVARRLASALPTPRTLSFGGRGLLWTTG